MLKVLALVFMLSACTQLAEQSYMFCFVAVCEVEIAEGEGISQTESSGLDANLSPLK